MKKIKYFETLRKKTKKGKYEFAKYEGYYQDYYDLETDSKVNVVFREDGENKWKATHLESGILIISGYHSRKACMEGMLNYVHKVANVLKKGSIQKIIDELETYRNEVGE